MIDAERPGSPAAEGRRVNPVVRPSQRITAFVEYGLGQVRRRSTHQSVPLCGSGTPRRGSLPSSARLDLPDRRGSDHAVAREGPHSAHGRTARRGRAPAAQPRDFRRAPSPRQPSGTETHGQPAPIFPLAIDESVLDVCGRHIRDEVNQLRYRSPCLVGLAGKAM